MGRQPGHRHDGTRRRPALGSGAPAHTQLLRGAPTKRVHAGAAQKMFEYLPSFNQPLAAWDVGQVTDMRVRRSPATGLEAPASTHLLRGSSGERPQAVCVCCARRSGCLPAQVASTSHWKPGTSARSPLCMCAAALRLSQGSCAHSCSGERPQAVCMCWHGAVDVRFRELFQPASDCMGRRQGHQHAGAPPPRIVITGLLRTQLLRGVWPQTVCMCWFGAVNVCFCERFQPAPGCMGC